MVVMMMVVGKVSMVVEVGVVEGMAEVGVVKRMVGSVEMGAFEAGEQVAEFVGVPSTV